MPDENGFSLISNPKLLDLYSAMLKCRIVDRRSAILFKQNNFRNHYIPMAGSEAAAVGAVIDLLPEDAFIPLRSYSIPLIVNGLPLRKLLSRLPAAGNPSPFSRRLHLAIGLALANKTKNNKKIAVVFRSGERIAPQRWDEALNVAVVHALPILFVRQEDPYAPKPSNNKDLQSPPPGIPLIAVDSIDIVAVYRVATEMIARARQGRGPTLIECQQSQPGDPILNMEKYLLRKGLFTEDWKSGVAASIDRELDAALAAAAFPQPSNC